MTDKISNGKRIRVYDRENGRSRDFRYYGSISMVGVVHTITVVELNLFFVIADKVLNFI